MFGWPRPDDLRQALQITRRLGSLVGVHAESEELSQEFTLQMQASGRVDRPVWCESRPPAVELEAVQKALERRRKWAEIYMLCTPLSRRALPPSSRRKAVGRALLVRLARIIFR